MGQRERLNCDAVLIEASSDPKCAVKLGQFFRDVLN